MAVVCHLVKCLLGGFLCCFRVVCKTGGSNIFPCSFDNLIGLTHAPGRCCIISIHTYLVCIVVDNIFDAIGIKSDDHARQIVSAEACKCVIDEDLRGLLSILFIPDQIDGILVTANIPQLLVYG